MDTDSFITHIKADNFYEDIVDNAEKRFYTSNHEVNRPLLRGKGKWGIMKDELEGKKCVIKRTLQFNGYKDWLFQNEIYIEAINKISLSSKDNKKFQTFDRVTSYQYGTNDGKVFLKHF